MGSILKPFVDLLAKALEFYYASVYQNYGVAIILLTFTVRLVLLPLTISQTKSMIQMQRIQPKLREIQEKYKNDREKLQQELMKLYSEHKINPMAGCLPLILQLPVFFALYQVLITYPQLKGAGFLWIKDLSAHDPYYIMLVLMVATTFVTVLQTQADPRQKLISYIMPLVFGFIGYRLPAGILLYWTATNVWSIAQQAVMARFGLRPAPAVDAKAEKAKEKGTQRPAAIGKDAQKEVLRGTGAEKALARGKAARRKRKRG